VNGVRTDDATRRCQNVDVAGMRQLREGHISYSIDTKLSGKSDSNTGSIRIKEKPVEKREAVIINHLGLHARAAAKLVTLCSRYRSRVVLIANGHYAEGRQFIALLMLSAAFGSQVSIEVSGPDEKTAAIAVTRLISDGFGER
jgi:phosphocarrier protein HPr